MFDLVPLDGNLFRSYGAVGVLEVCTDAVTLTDLQNFLLNAEYGLPLCICLGKRGFKLVMGSYQSLNTMKDVESKKGVCNASESV